MRHVLLLFLLIVIPLFSSIVHPMEIPQLVIPKRSAAVADVELDFHGHIILMTDQFYDFRKKILLLINSVKFLDKQQTVKLEYAKINQWLELNKKYIDEIFDHGMDVQEKQEKFQELVKNPVTNRKIDTSVLRQQVLLNNTLKKLYGECAQKVSAVEKFEQKLRCSPALLPFQKMFYLLARQIYFKTLSWILHDGGGKADMVAFLIGSRGYQHQEVPAFMRKIARENPQMQIVIYSIGYETDREPIADAHLQKLNSGSIAVNATDSSVADLQFAAHDRVDSTILNGFLSYDLTDLINTDKSTLSCEQEETLLHLPIIYTCRELPNIKLVSCYLQLPLLKSLAGYNFFKHAFSRYVDRKLNEGGIVFIGNHTQCYNFDGIPLVAHLYNHFKHIQRHAKADNLQLYTQCHDGQCIVYDPLSAVDQPVVKFYDHASKLFLPEKKIGMHCATVPQSQFISEDGLQYHLKKAPEGGMMISHVSGSRWEQPEILTSSGRRSRDPHHREAPKQCS